MTKDQEREALKKIADIIQGLGPDSYLSAAFDGCIELAESNIDNDFMESFKDKAERANQAELKANAAYSDLTEVIKRMENKIEDLQKEVAAQKEAKETALKNAVIQTEELYQERKKNEDLQKDIEYLQDEQIKLKAKLYDLMTA